MCILRVAKNVILLYYYFIMMYVEEYPMKKLVSVLLAAVVVTASAAVPISAAETDDSGLGIAVASDLHYEAPEEELEGSIDDEIYWYANRRAEMSNESGFIIDEFLRQCAENDECDYVLISGDLANNGRRRPEDHETIAKKLADFEKESGKSVFVIDGNHDVGTTGTTVELFKEIYADFGYNEALTVDEKTCSYTVDLGEKYRLIALDTCDPSVSTADGMNTERLDWVRCQVKVAKSDGRYPIVMMHHNLLDHLPMQRILSKNFIIKFHFTTAEMFADWGVKLVFSGHEHCSDATSYTSALGNVIYDFATTSLIMYPLEYRFVTLTDSVIKYEAKTIDRIDTDALTSTVKGYSEKQIDLMNAGLNAYAKGFFKQGIKYRLSKNISAEGMGVEEDSAFYPLVDKAVKTLNDLLNMPLYGENSVQELAKKYNIDIPDSEYKNAWDLATELVAAHYSGGESFELDSTEVTILLRTVSLILKTELTTFTDTEFTRAAAQLIKMFGTAPAIDALEKAADSVYGGINPGEYFIIALVSPLLYEFAFDSDGVDDNNGSIPGYGRSGVRQNLDNIGINAEAKIRLLQKYVAMFLDYISKMVDSAGK